MNEFLTFFIIYVFIGCFLFNFILLLYCTKIFPNARKTQNLARAPIQGISVVIAARNEVQRLPSLLNALKNQSKTQCEFEVIIVNDISIDETEDYLKKRMTDLSWLRIHSIKGSFPGKRLALTEGIRLSKYPYIAITDADCEPEQNWIQSLSINFATGMDFIFGIAHSKIDEYYTSRIGSFENFKGTLLILAAAKSGIPYSARAANFGFKKEAFMKLGGYLNTHDSLSGDDDLLIREAFQARMKVGYFLEEGSHVLYYQKRDIWDYLKQKARHTGSSHHYLFMHKFILTYWHAMNIFAQWSFIFFFISPWFAYLTLLKMIFEFITISIFQKKISYNFSFLDKLTLPFIYEFFIEVNFIYSLFRKSKW